ncbi:hypothetical protein [Arsukibacterium perlucidum]|uniref:hypothetical protein n=1 Tax=Arsukibacterium perlucidum TaxID=368811 RepID=UPI0003669ADC|nr:hypothetical protein [Arsukibacterium perlucidum]
MATSRFFLELLKQPLIGIPEQYLAFKARCPGYLSIMDNDKTVQWEGKLQPTPLSREYTVIIKYTLSKSPVCIVKEPDLLALAEGKKIPHTYQNQTGIKGIQLCLYLPVLRQKNKISDWQPTMFLADTILPWASIWLFYFECWLTSGIWDGGGVEHDESERSQR